MLETFGHKKAPAGAEAPIPNLTSNKRFHSSRKLPPFGRDLFYRLSQGQRPQNVVWIICGVDAWERAKRELKFKTDSAVLCLPYGDDPTAYRWPVAGLDCMVVHTGGLDGATLRALGTELVLAGSNRAIILDVKDELGVPAAYFKPKEC
jgi:hypothetical protein